LLTVLLVAAFPRGVSAAELRIRPQESILAVVTHKAGLASGLAHNHLVAATGYDVDFAFDPESLATTRFELSASVEELVVDDPAMEAAWFPHIRELGILEEPFGEPSDGDRRKIRDSMLGPKQLDAEAFPTLSATLVSVRELTPLPDGEAFPWRATVALQAHGTRVEHELAARYGVEGGRVTVEAFGVFLFSELGIKPFSAFLGAVKNRDDFHVYVHLVADEAAPHPVRGE
jgi:hypothetical protein